MLGELQPRHLAGVTRAPCHRRETLPAAAHIPRCPKCGGVARPNILMFGDGDWIGQRTQMQGIRLHACRQRVKHPVVIELGAGLAVPTVRLFGMSQDCPLVRINPGDITWLTEHDFGLKLGALTAVQAIWNALQKSSVAAESPSSP